MFREKFSSIVTQESSLGFERGISLFLESLNSDMEKEETLSENGIENFVEQLVEGTTTK